MKDNAARPLANNHRLPSDTYVPRPYVQLNHDPFSDVFFASLCCPDGTPFFPGILGEGKSYQESLRNLREQLRFAAEEASKAITTCADNSHTPATAHLDVATSDLFDDTAD